MIDYDLIFYVEIDFMTFESFINYNLLFIILTCNIYKYLYFRSINYYCSKSLFINPLFKCLFICLWFIFLFYVYLY